MSDERYAPPQAPVRDATRDQPELPRPWQVTLAARLICLSLLLELPSAHYFMAAEDAWILYAGVLGVISLILFSLAWALYRRQAWARWAYLGLCVVTYGLTLSGDDAAYTYPAYVDVLDFLSSAAALTALALLFTSPGARWFRALRD